MCKLCETKPVYEFTNKRKVCKTCFIRWFEKKVLYTIRKFKMVNRNDVVTYEKKDDFRSVVLEEILKMYSEKGFIEVVKIPEKASKKAITSTIDSESDKIVHELIKGKSGKLKEIVPVEGKFIKPLFLFLDKEIELYAKLKGLKYKKTKKNKDKISGFIEDLEKKHPEVKWAIVNSLMEINSV